MDLLLGRRRDNRRVFLRLELLGVGSPEEHVSHYLSSDGNSRFFWLGSISMSSASVE